MYFPETKKNHTKVSNFVFPFSFYARSILLFRHSDPQKQDYNALFGSTDMFRGLEHLYTDNTQHGVANDLALRICSAAKESLNDNENTLLRVASLGRKSQS